MTIAEQMGVTLQNTAYSVNIKERLDFSCAVFDHGGGLIANAPHMPVHLGSMGEAVRTIIRLRGGGMRPGDVYALNNPYNGGTHLPDVTTVMPVFGATGEVLFYTAVTRAPRRYRRHHARARCRPSASTSTRRVCSSTISTWSTRAASATRSCQALLESGPYPARNPAAEHRRPAGPGRRPAPRGPPSSSGWSASSASRRCAPTWRTSWTMPRRACAG